MSVPLPRPDTPRESIPSAGALRAFYVAYFFAVGVTVPYFPPYLRALGLSGQEVALVLSVTPLFHISAPLLWGWLADRTRDPALVLRVALGGAALFYAPLVVATGFAPVLFAHAGHQMFNVAVTGLSDTLALMRVRVGDDYGRARVWGSTAAIVTCLAVGPALTLRARPGGDRLVPALVTGALVLAFLAAFTLRGRGTHARPSRANVGALLRDGRLRFLLVFAAIHWACTAPYHGFFGILIRDLGLPPTVIGEAFVLGLFGEMVALFFLRRLRERLTLPTLLALVAGTSSARWLVIAFVRVPTVLILVQVLHAFTFGLFWGAALAWLVACVPAHLRATGQTLYTAATYGGGNLLGMLTTGVLYDRFGGASRSFLVAAVVNLVPLALALSLGRRLDPERHAH